MNENKIEILAPAGSMESLVAAVRTGADAVYLGAKDFSARASAQNFSLDELCEAVKYCRIRGVKVYLALNTLIFDSELNSALDLAVAAYNAGIDALIVQDIGLAHILRKKLPLLRLHGSTQMTVHTPAGAKALWEMGFSRVVLSRELSRREIEEIHASCPIELEVFVHGALCMCVSGQCYFSAMLGGRSGNRGMCAQPCRLPFSVNGQGEYALSLKDNSLVDSIGELEKIGVASAKIEGRMKRPEYVAAATSALRESRDRGYVSELTMDRLEGIFSRTGFTDGYFMGKRDKNMFGHRRKEDVTATDSKLLSALRQSYKEEPDKIPLKLHFEAEVGAFPRLTLFDGKNRITETAPQRAQKADSAPLNEEKLTSSLKKFGGTPYFAEEITFDISPDLFMSAKDINELRRSAVSLLDERRCATERKAVEPFDFSFDRNYTAEKCTDAPHKRARFTDTDIPKEFLSCELIFVPLFSPASELERLLSEGFCLGVEIPRGMFGREEAVKTALLKAKSIGIKHALVSNIGAVYLAKELSFSLHGGFGLNITNTASIMWAEEMGFADTELSLELSAEQINALGGNLPRGIVAGGYLPLMLCRCCPAQSTGEGCAACKKDKFLQDRMGKKFILHCDGVCTEVLNCVPLFIPDRINKFCNLAFTTFRFTVENSVEKVENLMSFSSKNQIFDNFTRGLYFRGVN